MQGKREREKGVSWSSLEELLPILSGPSYGFLGRLPSGSGSDPAKRDDKLLCVARYRDRELCWFPALILGLMGLSRDQVGQCGNGVLGIATLGFDSKHCFTLGG